MAEALVVASSVVESSVVESVDTSAEASTPLSWSEAQGEVLVWGAEKDKTGPYLVGFSLKIAEKH